MRPRGHFSQASLPSQSHSHNNIAVAAWREERDITPPETMIGGSYSSSGAAAGIGGGGTVASLCLLLLLTMMVAVAANTDSAASAPGLLPISAIAASSITIDSVLPTHIVRGIDAVLLSIRADNLASLENGTIATEQKRQQLWSCWFGADRDHHVDARMIADGEVQCWWNMTDGYYGGDGNSSIIETPIAISADEEDSAITLSPTFALTVTILEPMVVVSAFPPLGPTTGSTPVLVEIQEGKEMVGDADDDNADFALACLFGDIKVSGSRLNSTHVECRSPDQTHAGKTRLSILYDDEAILDDEIATVDRHTWFEYYEQPVLLSLFPSACTEMTNTTLTIHGSSFEESHSYTCRFGSGPDATVVPAKWLFLSTQSPEIQCTAPCLRPGSAVAVDISANGGIDYTSSGLALTVYPRFTVLSTDPMEGPMRGGMNLTVLGTNFRTEMGMFCHFGREAVEDGIHVRVEATVISPNELSCRIPPSPVLGNVSIEICWGDRLDCVEGLNYSYREELRILNVFPQSGPAVGGTRVRIELDRPFPAEMLCRFGSGSDASYSSLDTANGTSVGYCKSPANQYASSISTSSNSAAPRSTVDLTVTGGGYDSAMGTISFVYVPPISLTEIIPPNIPEIGAGIVRVVGDNYPNVEGLACLVGDDIDRAALFLATWRSETDVECEISDPSRLIPGSYLLYIVYGDQSSSSRSTNALSIEINPAISIANIIPLAGPPGTMVMVCGTNLASSSSMSCRFGSTVVAADTIINATCIRCLAPAVKEDDLTWEGFVSLSVSSNSVHFPEETPQLFFTYTGEPTIGSINPDTVDASRTHVIMAINGADMHPFVGSDTLCRLQGTNISAPAVLSSDRHAICEFQSMPTEPGVYSLELMNVDQMSFRPTSQIHVVPSPVLSTLEPSWLLTHTASTSSSVEGNNTVLLRGANFTDSPCLSCVLSGSDADEIMLLPSEWVSSSSVRCALPLSLRRGNHTLRVSNDGMVTSSTSIDINLYDPVQLHSLRPSKGGSGTLITVRGRDFIPGLACAFVDGDDPSTSVLYAASQFINSTCIQCTAPERGDNFGRMEVDVRLDQVSMSIGPRIEFDYVDLRIQSIHPSLGSFSGGTLVTINLGRSHFSGAVSHCRFGETIVKSVPASNGKYDRQCLSPPPSKGAVGAVTFALSANGDDFVTSGIQFEYLFDPVVDRIEPLHGIESGGTPLLLQGRQFANVSSLGCRFVLVGETEHPLAHGSRRCAFAAGGEWSSPEAMYCITPKLFPGNYSVELSTNGQDYVRTDFHFQAEPMATISAMSPTIARASGGSMITVVGTNFASNAVCRFDGDMKRASTFRSSNEIQCLFPSQRNESSIGSLVGLSISNNGKDFVAAPEPVLIYKDLRIDAFLPLSGSTNGGTLIVVRGGNFTNLSAPIRCAFGENEVESIVDSQNLLFCRSPRISAAHNVNLSIIYGNDRYSIPNVFFQYKDDLKVTGLSPTSLPTNINTTITVSGGPFRRSGSLLCCRIGDLPPFSATYLDSERVQCRLPRGVRPGSYPLSVANNCLDFPRDPPMVRVLSPVQVLAVSPARGLCGGGTTIYISGTNFANVEIERLSCQIGERLIVPAKERNSTHLLCILPPRTIPGIVPVQVVIDGVPTESNPSLSFEYIDLALSSISPASGRISGGTAVVVKLEQVHSANAVSHCQFGDLVVKAKTLSTGSDNEVLCMSPSLPEGKERIVPLALGLDSVHFSASQNLFFEYLPDPTIDRLIPSMGPEMGGTGVLVSGSDIANSIYLGCQFSRVDNAGVVGSRRRRLAPVTVDGDWISSSTMSCVAPRLFPGEYQVQIKVSDDGGGTRSGVDAGTFFVYPQLSIEQIDPVGGPVLGGTNVTVVGGPFQPRFELSCKFGDADVPAVYHNSSKVSCLAPRPMSTARIGPTNLSISANGVDYSNAHSFAYYISPVIRELIPSQGVANESTVVIIWGANFVALSPSSVLCEFGTVVTNGAVLSTDKLRCEAPALSEGDVRVRISLNNGADWSFPFRDGFAYKELGSVFSLSPSLGPWTGGTEVRVLGHHFVQSDTFCCRVGSTVARTIWISENEVYCVTPRQNPGQYAVSILNDCNNSASESSSTMIFEYYHQPITSSLNPSSGPSCGGTKLRIGGRHFRPGADGLYCMFDDSIRFEAKLTSTSNGRHIECLSPPKPKSHARQVEGVNVTVGDSSGAYHSEVELWFSYADEPSHDGDGMDALQGNLSHITVRDIMPRLGMIGGGTRIAVRGDYFDQRNRYQVVFGANGMVDAEWRSNTEIFCVSPPSRVFGEVQVTIMVDGSSTVATNHTFNYMKPVSVSEIFPLQGPVEGGTIVNVLGTNFIDLPLLSCRFEDIVVPAEFVSTNSLKCITPVGVHGPVSVGISVDGSTFYPGRADAEEEKRIDAIIFTYEHLPSIDHISPTNIPISRNANITIYGDHFASSSDLACRFDNLNLSSVAVVPADRFSDHQVSCVAPAAALGEVDVRISNNQVDWSLEEISLEYIQDAAISRISPSIIQEGVETALLVEGRGFLDSHNLSCHFGGGGTSTAATWHSPTALQCNTPNLDLRFAPGGSVNFSVSNNGGVHLSESVQLQLSARASVLSMSPSSGYKGQDVVVMTNHFHTKDGIVCLWGDDDQGAEAISASRSSHEIICSVPTHLLVSHAIALRIAAPGIAPVDAGTFSFLPDPMIDSLHPVHGPVSGGTNVTVVGQHLSNMTGCVFEISSRRNESSGDRKLVVPALALSSQEVACITPEVTHQTVAMVSLTTLVGGGHTTRGKLVFTYRHLPRLLTANPPIGITNTSITLTGSGFHDTPELGCRFGALNVRELTVVPARFVSSSLILCQAPSHPIGDATITVSTNGKDFGTAVPFRFIPSMEIHSISPRLGGVSGGTTVRITGTNIENMGSLSCKFGDTFVAATFVDRNALLCISPRVSAPTGVEITVTMNGKDLVVGLPNSTRFVYVNNPKVIAITPNKGIYDGGQEVRLITENVYHDPDSTLYCAFGKDSLVEAAWYNSTTVHCMAPAYPPGRPPSVEVSLVYEHTHSATHSGPRFSYIYGAVIASVEPVAGSTLGGTQVEILGAGFLNLNDLVCSFGHASSPARFIDETRVTCESPTMRAAGAVEVKVESSSASLQTRQTLARFKYYYPVSLYSIHPHSGSIRGGTRVQVNGAGFSKAQGHSVRCRFGNINVPGQYVSEQKLWCISPSLADTASRIAIVSFEVSMNGGVDWECGRDEKVTFEYVPMLQIESISPPSGPSIGGSVVEIKFSSGYDVRSADEHLCHFGDVVVGARAISEDTIECIAPQHEEGTIFLEVSRDGGDTTVDQRTFTYYKQPVIDSLQPPHGYARLGQTIRIIGVGFGLARQSDSISCRFDKRAISDARWVSSTEILCDAPKIDPAADPRQVVSVAVAINGIDFTEDNSTMFTYIDEPSVVGLHPSIVSADGGTIVTLEGKNIQKVRRCRFGSLGEPSPVLAAERNSIKCKAPAILPTSPYVGQSSDVYLESEGLGFHSIGLGVHYEPHVSQDDLYRISLNDTHSIPSVHSIEPNLIGSNGGTTVRVLGDHFVNSRGLACHFDSVVVPARFISSRVLQCYTPRMAPGIVMVNVVNGGPGQLVSKKGARVTVLNDASLTSIEPTFGPLRGGTLINIAGTSPPKCEAVECRFGSTAVHAISVGRGGVSCISPPLASRSPETVKVQVSCNGGKHFSESFATFSYHSPAQVTALFPSHGGVGGGTRVLVQGDNFQDSSRLACMFGPDSVTNATFLSRNQILCVSPPWHSISPASVLLEVTMNGQDYSQSLQKFEYRPKPIIDSIWPNGGPTIGSTEVFVTGSHFLDEVQLACSFDGITTAGTYIDNRTLSCRSPPHLPGIVSFRVIGDVYAGGDTSYQSDPMEFLYYNPSSVAFTIPRRGSALGGTPVILTGTNLFNTTALRCRFGKNEVRGTFISDRNVLCVSPPSNDNSKVLAVPVTVSLNDKDFSPENGVEYEYHRDSLPGHYSGPSSIDWNTPAPNGTYAEAGSVNFTLCDPGDFQPKAGQSSCLTCPVGFFCPDFGLNKPVLCPSGGVCDRTGLVAPSALCPRGHWCGLGTKTYKYNALLDGNEDLGILKAVHRLWKKSMEGIGNTQIMMPLPMVIREAGPLSSW